MLMRVGGSEDIESGLTPSRVDTVRRLHSVNPELGPPKPPAVLAPWSCTAWSPNCEDYVHFIYDLPIYGVCHSQIDKVFYLLLPCSTVIGTVLRHEMLSKC